MVNVQRPEGATFFFDDLVLSYLHYLGKTQDDVLEKVDSKKLEVEVEELV